MQGISTYSREKPAMTGSASLFDLGEPGESAPKNRQLSSLFADIVFDRPLDHAFTYSIPQDLVDKIGVGKRVEAPLGRGGKLASGFCVRITDAMPTTSFEIKPLANVL